MHVYRPQRLVRAAILVAGLAALMVAAEQARSAEITFAQRYSTTANGAIAIISNTNAQCSTASGATNRSSCAAALTNTNGNAQTSLKLNNNDFTMINVDQDGLAGTYNSTAATLDIPAYATVRFAGLYWSGSCTSEDTCGALAIKFRHGSTNTYTSYTSSYGGSSSFGTYGGGIYGGFRDVTSQVAANGAGAYWAADIDFDQNSTNEHAGWSLVVVYEDYRLPARNLTVFDGLKGVSRDSPTLAVDVSGFLTPPSGSVRTRIGAIGWDGDRNSTGDQLTVQGRTGTPGSVSNLSNSLNPTNNVFNSTVSVPDATNGTVGLNVTSGRTPAYTNLLGVDADIFNADGILRNNETAARFGVTTGGETIVMSSLTFQTDVFSPSLSVNKTVVDDNGGIVSTGDTLTYTIDVTNTGDDTATNVQLVDPVPSGAAYVASSASATGGQAVESGGTVRGYLGTGANAATPIGGTLAPGATARVTFQVTVTGANGTTISNTATGSAVGQASGQGISGSSNASRAVVGQPAPGLNTLTVAVTGAGSVSSVPGGITACTDPAVSANCTEGYNNGTLVDLVATAGSGGVFQSWGGDCSGTAKTCTVTMDQARNVTATFIAGNPLVVAVSGPGEVTSNTGGIACLSASGTCSADFTGTPTTVTLTAVPPAGSSFQGWAGGGCSGTALTCTVTMDQARSVTATFLPSRQLEVIVTGSGVVNSTPAGITACEESTGDCVEDYASGTVVTLTATSANGFAVRDWGGACAGAGATCTVTMDQAQGVTILFERVHGLQVTVTGGGIVESSPAGIVSCAAGSGVCSFSFFDGTDVELTATTPSGWSFRGWSGDCAGSTSTCTVPMSEARSVRAVFERVTPTGSATPEGGVPSPAELKVTVRAATSTTTRGSRIVYTVRTRNSSTSTADDVTTCVRLPERLSVVDLHGGTQTGRRVCWPSGTIAAGASATHTLTVRVVANDASRRRVTVLASATGENAKRASAQKKVWVAKQKPDKAQGVTG